MRITSDRGFALLEVLVSLIVVGIVMAALAPFMATMIRVTIAANVDRDQAFATLRAKIEGT